MSSKLFSYTKWILKVVTSTILSILLLLLIGTLILHLPNLQNILAKKAVQKIESELKQNVSIDNIAISLFGTAKIKGLFAEDNKGDTLIRADRIKLNINFWKLLDRTIQLDKIVLENASVSIIMQADSVMNFDPYIKAFSKQKTNVDNNKSGSKDPFLINIKQVKTDHVYFSFSDKTSNNQIKVSLGRLILKLNETDFNQKLISVKNILLEESSCNIIINTNKVSTNSKPFPFHFSLQKKIKLNKFTFNLQDNFNAQELNFNDVNLSVSARELNLNKNRIELDEIILYDSEFKFVKKKTDVSDSLRIDRLNERKVEKDFTWFIIAKNIRLDDNSFTFIDENESKKSKGVDFTNLQLKHINTNLNNINLHRNHLSVLVDDFSFTDKSGFKLNNLISDFTFSDKQTTINNFVLKTSNSYIKQSLSINYNSVWELQEKPLETNISLNVDSAYLGISDLHFLIPQKQDTNSILSTLKHALQFSTNIRLKKDTLSIDSFRARYDSTYISTQGYITNFRDFSDSSFAHIQIDSFFTTKNSVFAFLPDSILPANVNLPDSVSLHASFEGTKQTFNSHVKLNSGYGDIELDADITNEIDSTRRYFITYVGMERFELGKLLSNDSIGSLTQKSKIEGTIAKSSYSDLAAQVDMNIEKVNLLGYDYENLSIVGKIANKQVSANVNYADSNLVFSFSGKMKKIDSVPEFGFDLNIKGADLQALHITSHDFKIKAKMHGDFFGDNLNNGNGRVHFSDMMFVSEEKQFELDSLWATIKNTTNNTELSVISEPVQMNYSGSIKLGLLANNIKKHFSQYFPWDYDSIAPANNTGQYDFKLKLAKSELLTNILLPDLTSILPSRIESSYNARNNTFNLKVEVPGIQYKKLNIEALRINVNTSNSTHLKYSVSFNWVAAESFGLSKTLLTGRAFSDTLIGSLRMPDNDGELKFLTKAYVTKDDNHIQLHFDSDSIILNYEKFKMPGDNFIAFNSKEVKFREIILQSKNQQLSIENDTANQKEYRIHFSKFALSNIVGIIEGENEIIDGVLNGDVRLQSRADNSLFNADLIVEQVLVHNDTVFDRISVQANNIKENRIEIKSDLTGADDKIKLRGFMSSENNQTFLDFNLDINQLNLNYFESLLDNNLEKLDGSINGKLSIKGTTSSPTFAGFINLEDIAAKPTYLNTIIKIGGEKLNIQDNKVVFDRFVLTDSENNQTQIDGDVNFQSFTRPEFNLSLHAKQFRFLNTNYQEGRLYYGSVKANLDATLNGTPKQPNINVNAYLGEGSDFHFVIPELSSATIEQEGIVRFVDNNDTIWSQIKKRETEIQDSLNVFQDAGLNISANLEIDSKMNIYIELDPTTNEELFLNGNANLSFKMRSGETPSLNGRFEIQDGTYTLTLYEIIRRTFYIEPGSYLVWNGDIQNPVTDITTTYKVRTSPIPLISNETTNLSSENTSKYSNNTPFLINLNIEGQLLKPALDFELNTLPNESDALIQAKLAQLNQNEAQLHKQVFSLLLFNSFIENTLSSNQSTAYELNATARTSVSKLLTRQISSFADRYIKKIDLDVGVNSYYTSAGDQATGQTEVSLDLSKRLFNDQLTIKLGGDFNVESTEEYKKQNLSTVAGDVVIEYKIDEDGTYRIQGFNKTEYEDFFDGEVNKTGAAFIFNKDFYQLKELFNSDTSKKVKNKK